MLKSVPPGGPSRDLLASPLLIYVFFGLPAAAMVATGYIPMGGHWQTAVWTGALAIMGIACMVNAILCRRRHCYWTAPFFLLMALITLLFGKGILPLGAHGWTAISAVVLIGAIALTCLPEALWGKYRGHS